MVEMSSLAIFPLIALFSTIILIYILYTRARRSQAAIIWIIMLGFFLLWFVGEFAQKWLGEDPAVFKWAALNTIHGDIFPAIFLVFTLIYPYQNEIILRHRYLVIFLIIGSKAISTIISLSFGTYEPSEDWGVETHYGYYPYVLILKEQVSRLGEGYFYFGISHTFLFFALSTFVLIWKYSTTENRAVKDGTRLILIALFVYIVIAMTTILLPLMGYFPPELISLGNLIFNIIVAYGILQGSVLLFSPQVETEEVRDYSDTLKIGEYYICSAERGIETFTEMVTHGYEGLYIGAVKPNLDITKFKRTPIVILTETGKGLRQYGNLQYVPADELRTFKASILTFIQSATRGVIYVDNMDLMLEKGWAPPKEFVEMGNELRALQGSNALWLYGTPVKEDSKIEKLQSVMEIPIVKKSIVLDKLNSILEKTDVTRSDVEAHFKRLARIEPIFSYITFTNGRLNYAEDISSYPGILDMEPSSPIRLFVQRIQTQIPSDTYRTILEELDQYGISRFEFLLRFGDSYIVEETFEDRGASYEVYQDFVEKGFNGMCISRMAPSKVQERYLLPPDSNIYWLTQERKEDHDIRPAPEYLMVNIKNFIDRSGDEPGVILLDGLEYLITFQGDQFESYLKVFRRITDLISQSKLILLIPYDPEAIPPERIALFRRSGIEVITQDMLS